MNERNIDTDSARENSALLMKVGLRVTNQRLRVIALFRHTDLRHLSGDQVHTMLRAQKVDISLPTVYRVLSQLSEVGILARQMFRSGISTFELQTEAHHDHLVCLGCGRVDEFHDEGLDARKRSAAEACGYALTSDAITLYGYCQACRR